MRRWLTLVVTGIVGVLTVAGHAQGNTSERYLFNAANLERSKYGLPPLHWDSPLYKAAQAHAREMATRESISHQYPGEADLSERGHSAGARFTRIAENVAEAPTALRIHDAWMQSPGHRENLLDPMVDSVGISVMVRNGQLYAVEDFDKTVEDLSLDEQEQAVAGLVNNFAGMTVMPSSDDARRTCAMESGYAGARKPRYVMRFTAGDLSRLPEGLRSRLASHIYSQAAVGACRARASKTFSTFSVAVLLYQ